MHDKSMMDDKKDGSEDNLRKEFCPPLDDAVFYAIQSDYDLTDPHDSQTFVSILESLRQSAFEQENADFDPSGTGGANHPQNQESSESRSTPEEASTSLGVTSITTGLSELKWDDRTSLGADLEQMSVEEKKEYLNEMFTTVKPTTITPYTVSFVLKKCDGILCRAIDELLNLQSLEQEKHPSANGQSLIPKGIDGFTGEENVGRGRKGKSKKLPRTNESSRASSAASALTDASNSRRNAWTTSDEDVDFICSRTNLPSKLVRSTYHANGASLSTTIRFLSSQKGAEFKTLNDVDPLLQLSIVELKQDFNFVPEPQLFGLLTLTRNIPSAARELAEAMIASLESVEIGKISGLAQYAPLTPVRDSDSDGYRSSSPWNHVDPSHTRYVAASHGAAAGIAYTKAAVAYKRGKSDHLMGAAAGYYADVGRERAKAAKQSYAAAADALVASQSSSRIVDLHGVGVADAVRIANERVNVWWDNLGDAKYASGGGGPARDGFRVVTGIGRHSKDGAPRIGPAVSRMLVREGWKVEVGHGETIVYGKARR